MQIKKIYSSLVNPLVEAGKLFDGIKMLLQTKGQFDEKFYRQAIQNVLNKNKSVINTVRANWMYLLANYPFVYRSIYPEYLKKEEEIIKETKKRVLEFYGVGEKEVGSRISNDVQIMGLFAQDPTAKYALVNAYSNYVKLNPNEYMEHCPSVIKTTGNLLKFRDLAEEDVIQTITSLNELKFVITPGYNKPSAWQALEKFNTFYNGLKTELKTPEVKKALLKTTIAIVYANPRSYPQCTEEFKKVSEVVEAWKNGWMNELEEKVGQKNEGKYPLGFLTYLDVPTEVKRSAIIVPILEQIKSKFVNFLNDNFEKMFSPKSTYLPEMKESVEKLMNELRHEDFELSAYWEALENIKASPEYQNAVKKIISQEVKKGQHIEIEFVPPTMPGITYKDYEVYTKDKSGEEQTEIFSAEAGETYGATVLNTGKDYIDLQLDSQIFGEKGMILKHLPKTEFKVWGEIGTSGKQSEETKNKLIAEKFGDIITVKFIKDYSCSINEKFPKKGGKKPIAGFNAGETREFYILSESQDKLSIKVKLQDGYIYVNKDVFEVVEGNGKDKLSGEITFAFNKDCSYGLILGNDKHGDPQSKKNVFKKGTILIANVIDDQGDYINVQFKGNGSILNGLKKEDFELLGTGEKTIPSGVQPKLEGPITIQFKHDQLYVLITSVDPQTGKQKEINQTFFGEQVISGKVIADNGDSINIQFNDGQVAMGSVLNGLSKDAFEVVGNEIFIPSEKTPVTPDMSKAKLSGKIAIKFNQEYHTTTTKDKGINEMPEEEKIVFQNGSVLTVNVIDDEGATINAQLENGDMVHDIEKDAFEISKDDKKTQLKNIDNSKDKLMSGLLVKIKFNKDYDAILFHKEYTTKEFTTNHMQNYKAGEVIEVYVLKNNPKTISFQTQDDYVISNLPKEVFEVAK